MPTTQQNRNDQDQQSGVTARMSGAYDSALGKLDEAPMAALIGGLALGAVAGALLPRTQRETDALGPLANRVGQAAAEAARAAKDAGKQELGLSAQAKSPVEAIVDKALDAASAAGQAAAQSVTGKQQA